MATNKTIYLIRHGQTDYNRRGIVQGSGIDSDLNAYGRSQAQAFFDRYGDIPFDHVYTSELKRTIQSVEQFLDKGLSHTALPELNEINWGIHEGRESTESSREEFLRVVDGWRAGNLDLAIQGGETPNAMYNRQRMGWEKIMKDGFEQILICMHGRAMRSFLSLIMRSPLRDMDQYLHGNLCLYKLEGNEESLEIVLANDVTHLDLIPS